jgi:tape measure domain-containing protein
MLMRTMKAFIATGFITGADTEGMARALVQYTQVANYGRLQGDELRIMQEQGVNLVRVLQNAGLSDRIGSQTNPLTFEEVNTALLAFGESGDAVKMLGEVSLQGSVALTQMQNAITQDLLPALGKEFTPVVKDLAREMPRLVGAGRFLINNWETIGGSMATVWIGMKGVSIALTIQSLRAANALAMVAASGNAAAAAQGGGLLGGIFKKKPPKTAGMSVFKDTLGAGGLASALPSWGGAAGAGGVAGTAAMAGGVFTAGALALAGIVEGVGRLAGMSYDDTLFGQIENGLAGRGFKSGSQLRQEIDQEAERTFKPVREAEMRKAAMEKYSGRKLSRSQYFMETGDANIFATEERRAEMRERRQRSEEERLESQRRNEQRSWDAQRRRGGTSPRRASIDRANAEANARLNYGAGF